MLKLYTSLRLGLLTRHCFPSCVRMRRIKRCCCTQRCAGCRVDKRLCGKKIKAFSQDDNRPLCEQLNDAVWIKTAHLADTFAVYNETDEPNRTSRGAQTLSTRSYVGGKMSKEELRPRPPLTKQSGGAVPASSRTEFTRHVSVLREK